MKDLRTIVTNAGAFLRAERAKYIKASEVVANVESVTNVTLENEAQARVLAPLEKDIQKAVAEIAANTAPLDNSGKPMMTACHLQSVKKVLTDIIKEGVMDDGTGIPKPLSVLVHANIIEETYERFMRQKEYVKQAIAAKEARAAINGQPKLTGFAADLVKDLVKGIELWAADSGLHPALKETYERAKRALGEQSLTPLTKSE